LSQYAVELIDGGRGKGFELLVPLSSITTGKQMSMLKGLLHWNISQRDHQAAQIL
jgi:hypothetical protein